MRVEIVPCLKDNYSYLVVCETSGESAIVDACEAEPIVSAVRGRALTPSAIWSTHHHPDHTGANEAVAAALKIRTIVGHASDRGRIPGQSQFVEDGETFSLGNLEVRALHIPGHTTGAVAYVVVEGSSRAVFTGDTMFVAGCGRLFEGTPEMMFASFAKLSALEPSTRVYCGHEYTEANLKFAADVEPDNADVARAIVRAREARAAGKPTVPSTIGEELAINPFARAKSAEELGARRARKDTFK